MRERERDYCKKNLFQLRALFGMKHKMHALDVTITFHCKKSVDI